MQNSSQVIPLSKSTELDHSFIFSGNQWAEGKPVSASKPIAVFRSLTELDEFIAANPELCAQEHAGFAGYISYEGDCELAVYEEILVGQTLHCQDRSDPDVASLLRTGSTISFSITQPDPQAYIQAVKKCQEYIREGDIYQANIAHEFLVSNPSLQGAAGDPDVASLLRTGSAISTLNLYKKLCSTNPSPYAGYMNFSDYEIISASPELFLEIKPCGKILSSPIKGTAKLTELEELISSSKEKAEHIMIVDLLRNDLGNICQTGSVQVANLLYTQKLNNLYHLVSDIKGQLVLDQGRISFSKVFQAMCPGGSISGTPKIRALEIIKELESSPRGLYTGTMGYYRFKNGGRFSILIRSLIHDKKKQNLSFHVGSGITSGSDPEKELQETYLKAEKLLEIFI